ncbi:MAG TPA: hypothetical protein VF380_05220 [Solirubrobacteraceae bacterium]
MHRSLQLAAPLTVLLLVAAGCGGATSTVTHTVTAAPAATTPTAPQPQRAAREYPAAVRHDILVGCTHGATEAQCKCVLQKLEAAYTVAQLHAIERGMKADVAPPAAFTRIAAECNR